VRLPAGVDADRAAAGKKKRIGADFRSVLQENLRDGVKFSRHASDRLESRRIDLDPAMRERLTDAVRKADEKGARESLIILDNLCFVVSVKNRVVVTAIDASEKADRLFTNIDSTFIAR
jgi:flagellar operon protein